jgi:hypothetical protein
MGYACYEIEGMLRGYAVDDVCNHEGCETEIDRGLSYLCYCCTGYFCAEHRTFADESNEFECFAGGSSQCCVNCAAQAEEEQD